MIQNFTQLNKDNYKLYAAKGYTNYQCSSVEEFDQDLNIIKYIIKHLNSRKFNVRMFVNYFITFYNVFEPQVATNLLLFKTPKEHLSKIKTVLEFLNYVSEEITIDADTDTQLKKLLEEM